MITYTLALEQLEAKNDELTSENKDLQTRLQHCEKKVSEKASKMLITTEEQLVEARRRISELEEKLQNYYCTCVADVEASRMLK